MPHAGSRGVCGRSRRSCCSPPSWARSSRRDRRSSISSAGARRRRTCSTSAASSSSRGRSGSRVRNPQADDLTIASVTVDDAIVHFTLDGPATLGRLRSSTIVVPYAWVEDDPLAVGVTSSTGIETVHEVPAAVETPSASARGFLGYAVIGFLVGVVPIALGLLWLPSLGAPTRTGWPPSWRSRPACSRSSPSSRSRRRSRCRGSSRRLSAARASSSSASPLSALGMTFLSSRLSPGRPGLAGLGARAARRDRYRHPQPRRRARDRHLGRLRRAPARDVPDRRLHGPQRHRGPRHRGPCDGGTSRLVPAAPRPRRRRGDAGDRRGVARGLRLERRARRALLRPRRRRGAAGRRRGRPLRGPARPRRAPLGVGDRRLPGRRSRSCTSPACSSAEAAAG